MAIVAHEGKRQITCDSCPATYRGTFAAADFEIMVADVKAAGWKITLRAGVWTHTCPGCADRKGETLEEKLANFLDALDE